MTLRVVPLELTEANAMVAAIHRHHQPAVGHRFSLGAVREDGTLVGAAIIGRPVARMVDQRRVVEVVRVATDGTPNACSFLYGAAARAAKGMGFERIQTYTLPEEGGTSLRASGWVCEGLAGGGQWVHTDGKPRRTDQPISTKHRWVKVLNPAPPQVVHPHPPEGDPQLFDTA
jgi:hypothetical protein